MKKYGLFLLLAAISLLFTSCFGGGDISRDGIFAKIKTTKGTITVELFYEDAPITVANFIGLAEGTKEYIDSETKEKVTKPFYDGLTFHRVIKDFVIQGGCPLGNGSGSPGYQFIDEFTPTLRHDDKGILSMANSGPNTNGSQFFITLSPQPHLDDKHTVFGKAIDSDKVLDKIAGVKVKESNNQPYDKIYINSIKIIRNGAQAEAFDVEKEFAKQDEIKELQRIQFLTSIGVKPEKLTTNEIGLTYYVRKRGTGKKPAKGDIIVAHYTGYFEDGRKFDSSVDRGEPFETAIGVGNVIPGWDEAFVTMREGEQRVLILPYYLAYGEQGYPGRIPPKATLIFDVELIKVKKR
jgi:peptidyl-prolyl cis-trans isomerase A (cyclophilin A)